MNREERRNLEKAIKGGKVDIEKVKQAVAELTNDMASSYGIQDGDKVRINYEKIVNDVNYPKMNPEFKAWIEDHKSDILTVEIPESHKNRLFCGFAECSDDAPWLVFLGDLVKVDDENAE